MSKKSPKTEDDETTNKIPPLYKKKSELNGINPNKLLKDKIDEALENGKL